MLIAILVGLAIGFFGSIPLAGPVGVLVLHRAFQARWREALGVGMGASLVEGLYAGLALIGVATLIGNQPIFVPIAEAVIAGLLSLLGLHFLCSPPRLSRSSVSEQDTVGLGRRRRGLLLGVTLSAANPNIITAWISIATLMTASGWLDGQPLHALSLGLAVAGGGILWFSLLLTLLARAHGRMSTALTQLLSRIMGLVLLLCACWAAVRLALRACSGC